METARGSSPASSLQRRLTSKLGAVTRSLRLTSNSSASEGRLRSSSMRLRVRCLLDAHVAQRLGEADIVEARQLASGTPSPLTISNSVTACQTQKYPSRSRAAASSLSSARELAGSALPTLFGFTGSDSRGAGGGARDPGRSPAGLTGHTVAGGRRLILEVCADELSGALHARAAVHDLDRLVAKARLGVHRQHVEASAEPPRGGLDDALTRIRNIITTHSRRPRAGDSNTMRAAQRRADRASGASLDEKGTDCKFLNGVAAGQTRAAWMDGGRRRGRGAGAAVARAAVSRAAARAVGAGAALTTPPSSPSLSGDDPRCSTSSISTATARLDKPEMKTALGKLGLPNGTDVNKLFDKYDADRSGTILARRVRRTRQPDFARLLLSAEKHGHQHLQLREGQMGRLSLDKTGGPNGGGAATLRRDRVIRVKVK